MCTFYSSRYDKCKMGWGYFRFTHDALDGMKRQSHVLYSCQVVFGCGHNRGSGHETRSQAAVVKVDIHSLGDEKKEPLSLYTNVTSSLYIKPKCRLSPLSQRSRLWNHCQGTREAVRKENRTEKKWGTVETARPVKTVSWVASSKRSHTQAETFCLKEASSPRDRQNTADSLAVQNRHEWNHFIWRRSEGWPENPPINPENRCRRVSFLVDKKAKYLLEKK